MNSEASPPPVRDKVASGRTTCVARMVTEALAPAPTVALLLIVVAAWSTRTAAQGLSLGLLATLFASFIPFGFIISRVRSGALTDHHVRRREQRVLPLLVGIVSVVVGLPVLWFAGAPRPLLALVVAMLVGLATSLLVTLVWKISVHAAVTGGAVVILLLVFGPPLLVLAPLVGLVGWARVYVGDHTPWQVVAGAALGATVAAVVFPVLR